MDERIDRDTRAARLPSGGKADAASVSTRAPSPEAAVELRNVEKRFGRVVAVDGVDLTVPRGQTVAILGPNGAGKTTSIRLALGLLEPDGGTARVWGGTPRDAVAAGRVGVMLQNGGLTTGVTVREMVEFVRVVHGSSRAYHEVLDLVGLREAADRLVTRLSGGQGQRLRLALALVGDPDVLVLDEPTAGMDVEARHMFWSTMRDYVRSGRTLLFSTHYLKEADDAADRVAILAGGRVVADGPTQRIKEAAGGRVLRFRLDEASRKGLEALPGVTSAEVAGDRAVLRSDDADATVRRLLEEKPNVYDLEVRTADLEEAFIALTAGKGQVEGGEER